MTLEEFMGWDLRLQLLVILLLAAVAGFAVGVVAIGVIEGVGKLRTGRKRLEDGREEIRDQYRGLVEQGDRGFRPLRPIPEAVAFLTDQAYEDEVNERIRHRAEVAERLSRRSPEDQRLYSGERYQLFDAERYGVATHRSTVRGLVPLPTLGREDWDDEAWKFEPGKIFTLPNKDEEIRSGTGLVYDLYNNQWETLCPWWLRRPEGLRSGVWNQQKPYEGYIPED